MSITNKPQRSTKSNAIRLADAKQPVVTSLLSRYEVDELQATIGTAQLELDEWFGAHLKFGKSNQFYSDLFGFEKNAVVSVSTQEFVEAINACSADLEVDLTQALSADILRHRAKIVAGGNSFRIPLYLPRQRSVTVDEKLADFSFFRWLSSQYEDHHYWVGTSPGSLHFDRFDTALCQLNGEKLFRAYPPSLWRHIRLNPKSHLMPHHAKCAFLHWDTEAFCRIEPKVRGVQGFTALLGPGDAVTIPGGWFHAVLASSDSISLAFTASISDERTQRMPLKHVLEARELRKSQ